MYNEIDVGKFRNNFSEKALLLDELNNKGKDEGWCIFAGTLGSSYDVPTLIKCAERFNGGKIKFLVAGSRAYENIVKESTKKLNDLFYLGRLLLNQLIPIYEYCDIGLATYTAGSNVDMPDKFYYYTAAKLAVINSLTGEIAEHNENEKLGVNYIPGDLDSLYNAIKSVSIDNNLKYYKNNSNK